MERNQTGLSEEEAAVLSSLFEEGPGRCDPGSPRTIAYRERLSQLLPIGNSQVTTGSNYLLTWEESLHGFLKEAKGKLQESLPRKKVLWAMRKLVSQMRCELELQEEELQELLELKPVSKSKVSIPVQLHLHGKYTRNFLAELEKDNLLNHLKEFREISIGKRAIADAKVAKERISPDLKLIGTNLFAGALIVSVLAFLAPKYSSLGYLALSPFLIFGILASYLWIVQFQRILPSFLTSCFSLGLAVFSYLSFVNQNPPMFEVLRIFFGASLGAALGTYSGWLDWKSHRSRVLKDFLQENVDRYQKQEIMHPQDLADFLNQSLLPQFRDLISKTQSTITTLDEQIKSLNREYTSLQIRAGREQLESIMELQRDIHRLQTDRRELSEFCTQTLLVSNRLEDVEKIQSRLADYGKNPEELPHWLRTEEQIKSNRRILFEHNHRSFLRQIGNIQTLVESRLIAKLKGKTDLDED